MYFAHMVAQMLALRKKVRGCEQVLRSCLVQSLNEKVRLEYRFEIVQKMFRKNMYKLC